MKPMVPLYINDCFAWLHPAAGRRGVILCSAFGVEELVTHRFLRELADGLAAAGMPALRFDYAGAGDSLGSDFDEDRIRAWITSIREAVGWMRRETGVTEVALVGFRMGALLATCAAEELGDMDMLALVGSVTSGKNLLREIRALGRLIAKTTRVPVREATESSAGAETIEVAGFALTAATAEDLKRINLLSLPRKPANRVLLLGHSRSTSDAQFEDHLRSLGSEVSFAVLPGYAELEWNSSLAKLPANAFANLIRWLGGGMSPPPESAQTLPKDSWPTKLVTEAWVEEPVQFGTGDALFGVRCMPRRNPGKGAVLLVNHGSNHHIGYARMYVALARRLASVGISSLRFDIAGVGDSPAKPGNPENELYREESQLDVRAAIDRMEADGYSEFTLIGHCAGAYLSFYTAIGDTRVTALVMLNVQRFFWRAGDSVEIATRAAYRSTAWYVANVLNSQTWRRLMSRDIRIMGIGKALAGRYIHRSLSTVKANLDRLSGKEANRYKVVRWFRSLSRRGTRVLLIYGDDDAGLDELFLYCGPNARKIVKLPNIELRIMEGADHNMTPSWAREEYFELLENYLKSPAS